MSAPKLQATISCGPRAQILALTIGTLLILFGPACKPKGPEIPAKHRHGAALAKQFCSTCHLLPTPDLLPRRAYTDILNIMGLYLGHDDRDYGKILRGPQSKARRNLHVRVDASRIPKTALLPESDWKALRAYYEELAGPAKPAPLTADRNTEETKLPPETRAFRIRYPEYADPNAVFTAVSIDSARKQILAADAYQQLIVSLRADGSVETTTPYRGMPTALRPHAGGTWLLDAGNLFPSSERIGSLHFLDRSPKGNSPKTQTVHRSLYRAAHLAIAPQQTSAKSSGNSSTLAQAAYMGNQLMAVSGFGHHQGELLLLSKNSSDTTAKTNVLMEGAGFIRSAFVDFDRDGKLDLLALQAQARESLFLFEDVGSAGNSVKKGALRHRTLLTEHPAFGYTSFAVADINGDGFPDVITTNGDNGDLASKPLRSYHGIRVYLNKKGQSLKLETFLPLDGAYDVRAADFDGDGDIDLAAIAFYPDFSSLPPLTFVYYENRGGRFIAHTMPGALAGRWLVMDSGDIDGDGDIDLVLGAAYSDKLGGHNIQRWMRSEHRQLRKPLLILENRRR